MPCLLRCDNHSTQTTMIVCQSLGSRPILVQELFTLVPRLFGTTSHCLSVQPVQLLPSRNIWRHISLIWPFSHRYRHSPWPVDVTEMFPRFCCRATEPGFAGDIGAREVWLIDWLIDYIMIILDCITVNCIISWQCFLILFRLSDCAES